MRPELQVAQLEALARLEDHQRTRARHVVSWIGDDIDGARSYFSASRISIDRSLELVVRSLDDAIAVRDGRELRDAFDEGQDGVAPALCSIKDPDCEACQ